VNYGEKHLSRQRHFVKKWKIITTIALDTFSSI